MESDNPDIKWALDLLSYDPTYKPHLFKEHKKKIPSVLFGLIGGCYINHVRGLKLYSRPYIHLALGAVVYTAFTKVGDFIKWRQAKRDASLRDYVIRHPEDFPPPERKKYGELFDTWVPIR